MEFDGLLKNLKNMYLQRSSTVQTEDVLRTITNEILEETTLLQQRIPQ